MRIDAMDAEKKKNKSPSNDKSIAYEWQENFLPENRQCYHNIVTCNNYGYKSQAAATDCDYLTFFELC